MCIVTCAQTAASSICTNAEWECTHNLMYPISELFISATGILIAHVWHICTNTTCKHGLVLKIWRREGVKFVNVHNLFVWVWCRFSNVHFTMSLCLNRWTFASTKINTYSSVLYSHTVLMKVCGSYRQMNSVLYPNNHILQSSNIIFNGCVLNEI